MTAPIYGLDNAFPLGAYAGSITVGISATDTTLTSPGFVDLPSDLSASRPLPLQIFDAADPTATEVVLITAHAQGATTVTAVRGRYGTTARPWPGSPVAPAPGGSWSLWRSGLINASGYALAPAAPNGIVARHRRTGGVATKSASATEVPIMRLAAPVKAGRLYRIFWTFVGTATAVTTMVSTTVRYTTDGSTPSAASALLSQTYHPIAAVNTHVYDLNDYYAPTTDHTLTLLYAFSRLSGTGTVECQASATIPLTLSVEDLGPDPAITGVNL